MPKTVRRIAATLPLALLLTTAPVGAQEDEPPLSEATESCIFCHESLHPGIVEDWRRSRHARTTMSAALQKDELERRVSADEVPEELLDVAVGCAECHNLSPETHPDTVSHADYDVHTVVSPPDCAVCHPVEVEEYADNLMSHAYMNLVGNPLFADLVNQVNGPEAWREDALLAGVPHAMTNEDSCLSCHGSKVEVVRKELRKTALGEMEFAVLSGWPNQGVGRVNPDGSLGACSACHTRHEFSIEMARKPYTCAQCHKGPDTPANQVYEVSKHGNIFKAKGHEWDWDAVPWRPGEHFTAPTCATCHMSLLVDSNDVVRAERTHRMNDRLWVRLFGLPYAHPHPKEPTTHTIRNSAGLPLPTELDGRPVAEAVIDSEEQERRRNAMKGVCRTCHSTSVIEGQFQRLDHTIATTNARTLAATQLLQRAWELGVVQGLGAGGSIFDETLERMWMQQWLFYANSTRFASAMMGADYGVFAGGRFQMAANVREMETLLKLLEKDD